MFFNKKLDFMALNYGITYGIIGEKTAWRRPRK
jgi:hypothetical protein